MGGVFDITPRTGEAQKALVKIRANLDKITQAQAKRIFAATIPLVEQTKLMLSESIKKADLGFSDYAAAVASGLVVPVLPVFLVPIMAYGEDAWKGEAENKLWFLTEYSSAAVDTIRGVPQSEWTSEGLISVVDSLLIYCREAWGFYDRFSASIYAMVTSVVRVASTLLDQLLKVLESVLVFAADILKGAGNTLAWIGPLLTVLIPVAAIGGLIYLAKTGAGKIRYAGTPGHTDFPSLPGRRKSSKTPDYDI
jgi:hypothetical protein